MAPKRAWLPSTGSPRPGAWPVTTCCRPRRPTSADGPGAVAAAAAHYRAAIELAPTEPERRYLRRRLDALGR